MHAASSLTLPHGRDLTRPELRDLALGIAGRPELWRHLVRHDAGARVYEELLRDDHVAVWLICWMRDHDTGFHDQEVSWGGVAVGAGEVREDRLSLAGPVTRVLEAGQAFDFAASDIHRVLHSGPRPGGTIHRFPPAALAMGRLQTTPQGQVPRHSIS